MPDWIKQIGDWIIWVGGISAVLIALFKWFKKIDNRLNVIQQDTGDLLCDRLTRAHDYHTRKGYCPQGDKQRLCCMHQRYRSLGRNHLVDTYEQDLLNLPEEPTRKEAKV